MIKLSSDKLYYKGLTGMIILPIFLFYFFTVLWANDSLNSRLIIFSIFGLLYLIQAYKVYHSKRITIYNEKVVIETYFTNNRIEILRPAIISITKVFNIAKYLCLPGTKINYSYKIKYHYDGRLHKSYFFKNTAIDNIDDYINLHQVGL